VTEEENLNIGISHFIGFVLGYEISILISKTFVVKGKISRSSILGITSKYRNVLSF
jgi:hypothetical protein